MRKPGSLDYLKQLSTAVLRYDERWRRLDEEKIELSSSDEDRRAKDWRELIELAQEIHGNVVPKKEKNGVPRRTVQSSAEERRSG